MSAACSVCQGSGETGAYGVLDCSAPNCTAAAERLALEVAAAEASLTDYDARWLAYQAGKAAALEQAAKVCDEKYEARAASGHPREASAARALAEAIRALKP